MGAPNDLMRELWVENLAKGIEAANNGGGVAVEAAVNPKPDSDSGQQVVELEILDDSSEEEEGEEEEEKGPAVPTPAPLPQVTGAESVSVGGPKRTNPRAPPSTPRADQTASSSAASSYKPLAPGSNEQGGPLKNKNAVSGSGAGARAGVAAAEVETDHGVEADEAGVIGVVCEAVELAIERECATEDDAVRVLRTHLGANEQGALDRAVMLWCSRFRVDLPSSLDPDTTTLAVIAKWIFWVIQARTLLRARFSSAAGAKEEAEAGGAKDPLEDMVLGEWAGELGLGLEDVEALHDDPATRDEVTRDLAFWFAGKANEEQQTTQSKGPSSNSSSSMVVKRQQAPGGGGGGGGSTSSSGKALNRSLASLASEKRKANLIGSKTSVALRASARAASNQQHAQQGRGGAGFSKAGSADQAARSQQPPAPPRESADNQSARSKAAHAGAGAAGPGLVALEELSAAQRAALFMGMSADEKAEVILDLTPLERQPLLSALGKADTAELLAMDDVVMSLGPDELVVAGVAETNLSQRALALTRLSVDAKFKLFSLEGRQEALEIEEAKRATVGFREGASARPSDRAIHVVIAARVNLYHLMDHKSRVECLGHFTDRRERTDLLQALSKDDRQELIDACLAAEMAGHRDWFNGWDWFDWFDFAASSSDGVGGGGGLGVGDDSDEEFDGSVVDPVAAARRLANSAALGAYTDLVGGDSSSSSSSSSQGKKDEARRAEAAAKNKAREQADNATLDESTFTAEGPPQEAQLFGTVAPASSASSSPYPQNAFLDDFVGPGLVFLGSAQKRLAEAAQQAQAAATGEGGLAATAEHGSTAAGGGKVKPSSSSMSAAVAREESKILDEGSYEMEEGGGGGTARLNLPAAVAKEQERLQRRDGRLRDLEDGLRRIATGDGRLQELLGAWRVHKEQERKALASLALIQKQQADAARDALAERATDLSGRGKGSAAEQMNAAQATSAEAEAVRSSAALEAEVEAVRGAAEAAENAMKEARRLLLPSAHDRTDLAVLAQRVSVSYFSEVEMVKTQLAQEEGTRKLRRAQGAIEDAKAARAAGKLPSSSSSKGVSGEDLATLEFDAGEDLKLRIFTLELEHARMVSEAAELRRSLSEMNRHNGTSVSAAQPQSFSSSVTLSPGAQPDSLASSGNGHGHGGGELGRLRSELVSTRLQVAVLSESIASTQAEGMQQSMRAKAAEAESLKRKGMYESHGQDMQSLTDKFTSATKELSWVRSALEGTIAAKDRSDAKLHAAEAKLSTVAQLDPHRWHAGRQNVRLETELRAAREDRDRMVSRANKDVAHFKAEIALAADKLERSEAQLSSAVHASALAAEAHESEASDLEQRLLAMQALHDTANGRFEEQSRSFDELSKSHTELEASARAGAERLALYERRASLADESLGDARQQLVSLTKTHELMKAAEARRVSSFAHEKLLLEEARNESSVAAGRLQGQLAEARSAGQAVAKGLEASQQRVGLLENDLGSLLEQESDMRGALSETKGVLLKVTADYKQRMTEAASVARELRTTEQELSNRSEQLRVSEMSAARLREEMGSAHEKAALGAMRALAMQKHMVTREEEISSSASSLMSLAIDIEKPIAASAAGDEDDDEDGGNGGDDADGGEGRSAQMRRMVELQRKIASLTAPSASVLAGGKLDTSDAGTAVVDAALAGGGGGGGSSAGLPTLDNLKAELEAAQEASAALDTLAAQHVANVSGSNNRNKAGGGGGSHGNGLAGGQGGDEGEEDESVVFSDAVLMTETERILGLIDSVEARGPSVSMPRPPGGGDGQIGVGEEDKEDDDAGDSAV